MQERDTTRQRVIINNYGPVGTLFIIRIAEVILEETLHRANGTFSTEIDPSVRETMDCYRLLFSTGIFIKKFRSLESFVHRPFPLDCPFSGEKRT